MPHIKIQVSHLPYRIRRFGNLGPCSLGHSWLGDSRFWGRQVLAHLDHLPGTAMPNCCQRATDLIPAKNASSPFLML